MARTWLVLLLCGLSGLVQAAAFVLGVPPIHSMRTLAHDHDNQIFVRGMVEVARGLGKTTVAECVEDGATPHLLARLGVDKAQGYFLDRPQARRPAFFLGDAA